MKLFLLLVALLLPIWAEDAAPKEPTVAELKAQLAEVTKQRDDAIKLVSAFEAQSRQCNIALTHLQVLGAPKAQEKPVR